MSQSGRKDRARAGGAAFLAAMAVAAEEQGSTGRKKKKKKMRQSDDSSGGPPHADEHKPKVCRDFLHGSCDRGDQCRFAHEDSSAASGAAKTASGFHTRNRYQGRYNFPRLLAALPELKNAMATNPHNGEPTVDWSSPKGVLLLNAALLKADYGISGLEKTLPQENLVPPVPSRAEYIHAIGDLLAADAAAFWDDGAVPSGAGVLGIDVGTGASAIYPLIGGAQFGWRWLATDIDPASLAAAAVLLTNNGLLVEAGGAAGEGGVHLVRQTRAKGKGPARYSIFEVSTHNSSPFAAFPQC